MSDAKQAATPPAQEEAQGWRPTEGDALSGNVVGITKAWSDWSNSFYPLLTIHDATRDEDVDLHCFHHTLKARIMELKPKVGDPLEVTYLGQRKTKDGKRTVTLYRVDAPGATGQEVWDQLDAQDRNAGRSAAQGTLPDDSDIPF